MRVAMLHYMLALSCIMILSRTVAAQMCADHCTNRCSELNGNLTDECGLCGDKMACNPLSKDFPAPVPPPTAVTITSDGDSSLHDSAREQDSAGRQQNSVHPGGAQCRMHYNEGACAEQSEDMCRHCRHWCTQSQCDGVAPDDTNLTALAAAHNSNRPVFNGSTASWCWSEARTITDPTYTSNGSVLFCEARVL